MNLDTRRIERDVAVAVGADTASIAERVRTITLAALTEGRLDGPALRGVMNAVLEGAQKGALPVDAERSAAFGEAIRGLDEALAGAAQATGLAMQEAVGRGADFSRESLHRSLEPFSTLEKDFIGALGEAARRTCGHAQATLHGLAEHMRNSGTASGARVRDAFAELARTGSSLAWAQLDRSQQTLRNQTDLLASLSAGMLRGLADRLSPAAPDAGRKDPQA